MACHAANVRHKHGIAPGPRVPVRRARCVYTAEQAAELLGVTNSTVIRWVEPHCPRCGAEMKLIAEIQDPAEISKILAYLVSTRRAPPGLDPATH